MKRNKIKKYRLTIFILKNDETSMYKFSNRLLLPDWVKEEIAYTIDKFLRTKKDGV